MLNVWLYNNKLFEYDFKHILQDIPSFLSNIFLLNICMNIMTALFSDSLNEKKYIFL